MSFQTWKRHLGAGQQFKNAFYIDAVIHLKALVNIENSILVAHSGLDRLFQRFKNAANTEEGKKEIDELYRELMVNISGFQDNFMTQLQRAKIEEAKTILALAIQSGDQELIKKIMDDLKITTMAILSNPITPAIKTTQPKITMIQHFFGPDFLRTDVAGNSAKKAKCLGDVIDVKFDVNVPASWDPTKTMDGCAVNWRDIPAEKDRKRRAETLKLRFIGSMTDVRIKTKKLFNNQSFYHSFLSNHNNATSRVYGTFANGVFDVQIPDLLDNWIEKNSDNFTSGKYASTFKFYVTAYNSLHNSGKVRARNSRPYEIRMISPIVLNFRSDSMIRTQPNNGLEFDIDNDGFAETTGWVAGRHGGFLALDLNQNGKIDHGGELFGDATETINGKKAINGYAALKHYDVDKNGKIDAQDPVFKNLLVWFDYNQNAHTEKGELKTMEEVNVTALSTNYRRVAVKERFQNYNDIRYEAKFFGPATCEDKGCRSFDIYFNTGFYVK